MRDDYKDDCHKMGPGRQVGAAKERGRYFRLIHRGAIFIKIKSPAMQMTPLLIL